MTDETNLDLLVAELETGFNDKDGDRMAACLVPDAIWVNPAAEMTVGRENILAKFRTSLATSLKDYFARYDRLSVRRFGDDVAVVHVRQRPVTRDGENHDSRSGSVAVYVCHRTEAGWRIAAAQNTIQAGP